MFQIGLHLLYTWWDSFLLIFVYLLFFLVVMVENVPFFIVSIGSFKLEFVRIYVQH